MTDVLSALGRVVVFAPAAIAIAVLPYCLPATAGAANPFGRYVYVTDTGIPDAAIQQVQDSINPDPPSNGKLYQIDVEGDFGVRGPVDVGRGATGVTVSAMGIKIYVANSHTGDDGDDDVPGTDDDVPGTVSIVDAGVFPDGSNESIEVPVGIRPMAVAASPDPEALQKIYVANSGSDSISVIDRNRNQVHAAIGVGERPNNLVVTPDGKHVYVSNAGSDTVSVIDTDTYQVVDTIAMPTPGTEPDGISVSPDGSKVYVVSKYTDKPMIIVIDTETREITATLYLRDWRPIWGPAVYPVDIAVNPSGGRAVITNPVGNSIFSMSTSRDLLESSIKVMAAHRVSLSPDGGSAYITQNGLPKMSVVDTASNAVERTVLLPDDVWGTVATPNLHPVANMAVQEHPAGRPTLFDGSDSYDMDGGGIAKYRWDFGDGSPEESTQGPTVSHIYQQPGTYPVTLAVTDNEGLSTESIWAGRSFFHYGSSLARQMRNVVVESAEPGPGKDDPGPETTPDPEEPGFPVPDHFNSIGPVGGEEVQSATRCERPELKTTLKAPREMRLSEMAKGKSVKVQASGSTSGKGKIQLSIRGRDASKLGLYTGKSKQKEKRLAAKSVSVSQSERTIGLKVAAGQRVRLKRALKSRRRGLPKTVKLKVTLVAQAAVTGRTLQTRSSLTISGRRSGKIQRRTQINKRSIRGVSPCAKQLKLKLKAPGDVKLKRLVTRGAKAGKGISPRVWCSNDCTGTVEMRIWGRHGRALRLYRSKSKTKNKLLARKKVRLHAGTYKGLTLRVSSKSLRKILAKAYRRRDGLPERVKAQILFKAGTKEGANGRAARTLRVRLW